jgi:hypothetical protein
MRNGIFVDKEVVKWYFHDCADPCSGEAEGPEARSPVAEQPTAGRKTYGTDASYHDRGADLMTILLAFLYGRHGGLISERERQCGRPQELLSRESRNPEPTICDTAHESHEDAWSRVHSHQLLLLTVKLV